MFEKNLRAAQVTVDQILKVICTVRGFAWLSNAGSLAEGVVAFLAECCKKSSHLGLDWNV